MKLKEIKPGMVIHCKTEEEAKLLSEYGGMPKNFFEYWSKNYKENTCYHLETGSGWYFGNEEYYTSKGYEITQFSSLVIEEKTYEDGLNEAWAAANKLADMMGDALNAVFGFNDAELIRQATTPFSKAMSLTPQEVISKLEAYEAEKRIEVGNIVNVISNESYDSETGIFLGEDHKHYWVLLPKYSVPQRLSVSRYTLEKTGKHIDISSILLEIGKE